MRKKKIIVNILLMAVLSTMVLGGCGSDSKKKNSNKHNTKQDTKEKSASIDKDQYLNLLLGSDPQTLDPSKVYDVYSTMIHVNTMEALTRLETDKDGKDLIKPGIAESWETSKDGLTWTFKLRDAKWSDGKEVTAEQFVYGITRTLDSKTASPCGYLLFPIKNGEAFNSGKAKIEDVGVKALDKETLEIKLEHPCAYFLNMTYSKIMEPQRKDIIEKSGEKYGSEANTMLYTGPFKISSWVQNSEIKLEKNSEYWDKDKVKLEKVTFKIIKEESARMNELLNCNLDLAGVSSPEWIKKLNDTNKFTVKKGYDTSICYTFFNQKDKYLKNAKIRKALLLAQDREGAVSTLYKNLAEPAYAWVPPTVFVGSEEFRKKSNYEPINELKKENPDPKALLVEGLKEENLDPNPENHTLTLLQSGTSSSSKQMAEFDQQNFKSKLGINIKCNFVEWPIFQKRTNEQDYQIASQSVSADYNDPITYFDMFMSTASTVPTGWENSEYDELVRKASKISDNEERCELFNEAEKIFIYKDAVVSPTVWRLKNTYVHNYVKEYMAPTFGSIDLKYTYTEGRDN